MSKLPEYKSLEDKREKFKVSQDFWTIDTIDQFNLWYRIIKEKKFLTYEEASFFRGSGESKFKLFTSGQRMWIEKELRSWSKKKFLEFIDSIIEKIRQSKLFPKVFDFYDIVPVQRDFPILSIIQHYGGPTPLLDWTYNIDVALFFATEYSKPSYSLNPIDNYFSIYIINKNKQPKNELLNLFEFSSGGFPQLSTFYDWGDDESNPNKNGIFYISDYENKKPKGARISFKDNRPMTTIYNQNILPQEGLFIFNPFSSKPVEDCFNVNQFDEGWNLQLTPFTCVNIKKDIAEYIRRKINKEGINIQYIYPQITQLVAHFKETAIDDLI
jgi:hypothetical protein